MTDDFRSYNVIYICLLIVRAKIIGHYSLLIYKHPEIYTKTISRLWIYACNSLASGD